MTNFDDRMNKFFQIDPIQIPMDENTPDILPKTNLTLFQTIEDDLIEDYENSRNNLNDLIDKGKEALDDIMSIAKETEKGRDYEVAAGLLRNLVEANEKILDIHKKIREISNYKDKSKEKTTVNNTLFVGSTNELNKLLKQINDK